MDAKAAPLTLMLGLAACATPQEQCIQRETRELRTVDALIAESEATLRRGYALEETTVWQLEWIACDGTNPVLPLSDEASESGMCLEQVPKTVSRPKAVDLTKEKRILGDLMSRRSDLEKSAAAAIAACKNAYPE